MRDRYGPWAVVAGASEGIGAAFARALCDKGLDVVLVARRPQPLASLAAALPGRTMTVAADLSTVDGLDAVFTATDGLDVGLVVHNAAYSPIGPLTTLDPADTARALDLGRAMAKPAPGTVTPDEVVRAALGALGRRPRTVPGGLMRVSAAVMSRVLPRRTAIVTMGRASKDLSPPN